MGASPQFYPEADRADAGHTAEIAVLKARTAGQIAAVRRAAEVALQAQENDLREQAARQVEAAVRAEQAEAARIFVETMRRHDALVERVCAQAHAEMARAREQMAELEQDGAVRVQAPVAVRHAAVEPRPITLYPEEAVSTTPPFHGFVILAGVVALAGLTGTLVGWLVSLWGLS